MLERGDEGRQDEPVRNRDRQQRTGADEADRENRAGTDEGQRERADELGSSPPLRVTAAEHHPSKPTAYEVYGGRRKHTARIRSCAS